MVTTPRLDHLDPGVRARVLQTVGCADCTDIPKVPDAGEVKSVNGRRVQVMHNGLLVEEGCYFGPWMDEIIRVLHGHHEPQEELVFHRVLERLADSPAPTMIELGSFWTYYGMWFARQLPGGRVLAMEPDPGYLAFGPRNAALNGLSDQIRFVSGAIGGAPGSEAEFQAQSDGRTYQVMQHDLGSLMAFAVWDHVDLVLSDIQGFETTFLQRARVDLTEGRVRFLIVSTHHFEISGSPTTHQEALALLRECGGQIIAEHTPSESVSGDGLIAVSFDARDRDFAVAVTHARAKDTLFGELEPRLAQAWQARTEAERKAVDLAEQLDREREARAAVAAQLAAVEATKLWRWSGALRRGYGRLRQRRANVQPRSTGGASTDG